MLRANRIIRCAQSAQALTLKWSRVTLGGEVTIFTTTPSSERFGPLSADSSDAMDTPIQAPNLAYSVRVADFVPAAKDGTPESEPRYLRTSNAPRDVANLQVCLAISRRRFEYIEQQDQLYQISSAVAGLGNQNPRQRFNHLRGKDAVVRQRRLGIEFARPTAISMTRAVTTVSGHHPPRLGVPRRPRVD